MANKGVFISKKKIRIIALVLLILILVLIAVIFLIPFPYTTTETYTEIEPYIDTETYSEEIPYQDTECETRKPRVETTFDGKWSGGSIGSGTYTRRCKVTNFEQLPVTVDIEMDIGCNDLRIETVNPYPNPKTILPYENYVYSNKRKVEGSCSFHCDFEVEDIEECKEVTKFKKVEKQRTVTKYKTVEKNRLVTNYIPLFRQFI